MSCLTFSRQLAQVQGTLTQHHRRKPEEEPPPPQLEQLVKAGWKLGIEILLADL